MSTAYTHQITVRATEESVKRLDWFAEKLSAERGTLVTRADALRELAHTALRDHESGFADEAQLASIRRDYELKKAALDANRVAYERKQNEKLEANNRARAKRGPR